MPRTVYSGHMPIAPVSSGTTPMYPHMPTVPVAARPIKTRPPATRNARSMVPIEETIKGFNMIMDGAMDEYPESAFNLKGNIEDVITAGKKIMAEAAKA